MIKINNEFWNEKTVLVTGGSGFVGKNILPLINKTSAKLVAPKHADYDLLEQNDIRSMFKKYKPDIVLHLAALSGGIMANKRQPADYCYKNLYMGTSMMHESWRAGVEKYITLIGGCSYPANANNPIKEEFLWEGYPQKESAPYSIAKKMSVVQSNAYRQQYNFNSIVLAPGNLYGPHDNFDLQASHVIPALIRKFSEASKNKIEKIDAWGTGRAIRDFIYIEDACEAIFLSMQNYNESELVNISSGEAVSIRELVELIADLTSFQGEINWDSSKPEGQLEKVFSVERMKKYLDYQTSHTLREGITKTIKWLDNNYSLARLSVSK
jgi:GDP-L-fucose synthase